MNRMFCASQSIGAREEQEDSYGICWNNENFHVYVLADGMGGHVGGAVASQTVIDAIKEKYDKNIDFTVSTLEATLVSANDELQKLLFKNPKYRGFGTTLILAIFNGRKLYWVSVGDSILFGVDKNYVIHRLNDDHSMKPVLDAMVAAGELDQLSNQYKKQKNQLRSALQGRELELYQIQNQGINLDDYKYIGLASDGLDSLRHEQISSILRELNGYDLASINLCIMDAVRFKKVKNQDNTTLIMIDAGQ